VKGLYYMKKYFKALLFLICSCAIFIYGGCNDPIKDDTPTEPINYYVAFTEPPEWSAYTSTPYAIIKINEITDEIIYLWHRRHPEWLDSVKINCSVLFIYGSGHSLYPDSDGGDGTGINNPPPFDTVTSIYIPIQSINRIKTGDMIMISVLWTNMYDVDSNSYTLHYAPVLDDEGNAEFFMFIDGKINFDGEAINTKSYIPIDHFNSHIDQIQKTLGDNGVIMPLENGMTVDEVKEFFNMITIATEKISR